MNPVRRFARAAGLGRAAYQVWHRPFSRLRDFLAHGGPIGQHRNEAGRRAMEAAARHLTPREEEPAPPLVLHLLTGRRFWYQTAFCLWSLAQAARRPVAPVIHDDGSLDPETRELLRRLFPRTAFADPAEIRARREDLLPAGRFPALRERLDHYPHLRKLVDPHLGQADWKLVADSDLLFFHQPQELMAWHDLPARPLHAVDCATSYGYSRRLMQELGGGRVAERVNVGLTGLNGAELDWDRIERWSQTLIAAEGKSYYLEQALVALIVAGRSCTVLPADRYVTRPRPPEAGRCDAVMHHYVADSKRWYFRTNWRRFAPVETAPLP
jgi:hypothetical protein